MTDATKMENQAVFVDFCARCGEDVLHWYEQVGMNQAVAPMAIDPLVQGPTGDRFVVCPHCGAENASAPLRVDENDGAREAITGLRAPPLAALDEQKS